MAALARWCFQRRTWVLVAWLALVIILGVGGRAAGTAYSNNVTLPGTGSTTALTLLEKAFPGHAGDQDTIVWRAAGPGGVRAPAVRAEISAMLGKVAGRTRGRGCGEPVLRPRRRPGQPRRADRLRDRRLRRPGSEPARGGRHPRHRPRRGRAGTRRASRSRRPAAENALQPSFGLSAAVGIVGAAVVLFIAFGSLLSMLLPLAVAIATLASGLMTVGLLSHGVSIPSVGPTLGILIGLGVGIDYALFIVTRHRSNLKDGMPPASRGPGAEHLGQGCPVRRHHGVHRPDRHARAAHQLHLRPRDRRRSHRAVHGRRRHHPAARAARLPRHAGAVPSGPPPAGPRRTGHPGRGHGWPRSSSATPPRWPPPPP